MPVAQPNIPEDTPAIPPEVPAIEPDTPGEGSKNEHPLSHRDGLRKISGGDFCENKGGVRVGWRMPLATE